MSSLDDGEDAEAAAPPPPKDGEAAAPPPPKDGEDAEAAAPPPKDGPRRAWRENLALVISGVAVVVAVGGTIVANREADAARDQADAARDQADIARAEFERDADEQARRVAVRAGALDTLTVENASNLPIHDVRVFLGADPDYDGQTELVVEYEWLEELPACTAITWRTGGTSPDDLVVYFTDDVDQQWRSDAYGDQEKSDLDETYPDDFRFWRHKTRPVQPCE